MAANVQSVPAVIKGHRHFSYGGAILPESVTIQQYYDLTPFKKSNLRMTDELLPKPTEINLREKVIKSSIPREHSYRSHIASCALFPTYCHSDDLHSEIWNDSDLPLLPQVTVLSKTKGAPYRHELHQVPMATGGHTTVSSGQNGLQILTRQGKETAQVFCPTPQKMVYKSYSQQEKNTALPERTANVLNNLEKTRWLTSNQLDYTGTGPTNPLQLDDFDEKKHSSIIREVTPHRTHLTERSYPTFLPSRPVEGRKARILQNRRPIENAYQLPNFSTSSSVCEMCSGRNCECRLRADLNDANAAEARTTQLVEQHNFQEKESGQRQLSESRTQNYIVEKNSLELYQSAPATVEGTDRFVDLKRPVTVSEEELNDAVLPFPPVQIHPRTCHFSNGMTTHCSALSSGTIFSHSVLLELQNSFSRTEAHRRFHESMQSQSVDLRDNLHSGRKHSFYGFNSYFFRN